MNKDLLAKLRKTVPVTLPSGVVRPLDDSELDSVVGGMKARAGADTYSCSPCQDDCTD
jgi:hypothetical protein